MRLPCAICGVRPVSSRDHVPPRGLFVNPRPSDSITVGACTTCNNGASHDDNKFKIYLALHVKGKSAQGEEFWLKEGRRALINDQSVQRALSSDARELGRIVAGRNAGGNFAFRFPERVHSKTVERMARGLYFHHFNEILGDRAKVTTGLLDAINDEILANTSSFSSGSIGQSKFAYRFGTAAESPLHSVWLFEFYQAHWSAAYINPIDQPW